MTTLSYVGSATNSSTVVPKQYADAQFGAQAVTKNYIFNQVLSQISTSNQVTQQYFDTAAALLANKTDVDNADTSYVPTRLLGAVNGVASLDVNGQLPAAQFPSGMPTDRTIMCYAASGSQILLTGSASKTVGQGTPGTSPLRATTLAQLSIPDPGYPYVPLPFAWVQGSSSSAAAPASSMVGNSNFGLLTAMPPDGAGDTVYGAGTCTASPTANIYSLVPYARPSQTPTSYPYVTGNLQLNLYGSSWATSGQYTFYGTNLTYLVLVVPSI